MLAQRKKISNELEQLQTSYSKIAPLFTKNRSPPSQYPTPSLKYLPLFFHNPLRFSTSFQLKLTMHRCKHRCKVYASKIITQPPALSSPFGGP